ncbi:MAG: glucose-1-phosphate adenylyltransferase subunit GlgD [Ruminococcaceae bacterium]|nr:glucose-1-phosphate adenylyltransferase subunit GlgD [Oscillospiraceae bacterium]
MIAAGLIFSNIHDQSIPEMTRRRTMASIPFGCRYRLIDFALSNMVNSDITNVGVITHYNYQSLMDHIGNGKDWDLARRSGGIKILPPYVAAYENHAAGKLYESRLEALMGSVNFINRCGADYLVLSDCDVILNIDLSRVIEEHIKSEAYITLVTKKVDVKNSLFDKAVDVLTTDEDGRVTDISFTMPKRGSCYVNTNLMVISRTDLQNIVSDSIAHGYKSFTRDIIAKQLKKKLIRTYVFDGFAACISSLENYFSTSMMLLDDNVRRDLFSTPDRKIFTKIRNSAPTKYASDAVVKNSMIADGCTIEGTVENSIIFRGVHVGKGTVVKNSILLQDTYVGAKASLNCVIADKNVVIKDGRTLSGYETMPFFIGKGTMV